MASLADMLSGKSAENLKKISETGSTSHDTRSKTTTPQKTNSRETSNLKRETDSRDTYHVHMPDFVAVDLETTGLDKRTDRITEIGMVRYAGGREVASYSKLINPQREIPPFITKLTGISNEMVKDAPQFRDIADEILDFIGRNAICGHQVDFEFSFLNMELERMGRGQLRNLQIDTLSTARMLLTQEEGYALGKVANALGIELENAHRALDDARASGEICLRLLPKIGELPPQTRFKLANFAPFSLTRKILESSVKNWHGEANQYRKSVLFPPREPINGAYKISADELNDQFKTGGKLNKQISNWIYREEQERFASTAAEALNSNGIAALEAGTGTGKSLGYLIPAALWALNRGERVIVSTNTKNLQDQLIKNDLPLVKKAVGEKFNYCSLKGRGNYLCKAGLEQFLSGETGTVSVRERGAMMPLIKWADETETGDIEELNSFNQSYHGQIWGLISAENKRCDSSCAHFGDCFMINAKKRAANAHVVVGNHALFYSDITAGSPFTGEAGALIIDEAHNLESSGHRMLRVELDTKRIEKFTDFIQQILTTITNVAKTSTDTKFTDSGAVLKKVVKRLRKNHEQFLEEIMAWGIKRETAAEEIHNQIATMSYGAKMLTGFSGLAGYKIALNDTIDILEELRRTGATALEKSAAFAELKVGADEASQIRADLVYLTDAATDGDIFWMDLPENRKWVKLIGTTVDVSDFLGSFWKEFHRPVIFTSATLSYKDDLSYFVRRVGAESLNPITAQFNGSFEKSNTLFLSRPDAPDPSHFDFVTFTADQIMAIHERFEKNMMVLFTSNGQLAQMHEVLEKRFSGKKIPLFAQGISGNRAWITQQMSEVRGAILLGSGSFWEGVDIPGEGCEIVVIPKLPFPVPSHPLAKALAEKAEEKSGRNGFVDYHLPEALLKFRQGTGRLIRHDDDRGALLVLDSRMDTKPYGKKFIKLVNSDHVPANSTYEMLDVMSQFFGEK